MHTFYLFIILIIIIILCLGYLSSTLGNKTIQEKFETYMYGPYNYRTTGSDPLTFYQYPVYRAPLDYPYKHYSSYPYPYLTYKENIL
jgi:hypothetical protein